MEKGKRLLIMMKLKLDWENENVNFAKVFIILWFRLSFQGLSGGLSPTELLDLESLRQLVFQDIELM